jgi:hypothetical protein
MTESQWLAWVRSALRSKWLRWKPRADALRAAQEPYKGENKRQKFAYRCAMCNNLFSQKDVEVDHFPRDAGSILSVDDIGEFCNNLFCETDNLRVVCKICHSIYTLSQRNGISLEEARLQKQVIEICKDKQKTLAFLAANQYNVKTLTNAAKRREAVESILREKMSA